MIYYVNQYDTVSSIASKFKVSKDDILRANVICNENLLTAGDVLIIPDNDLTLPKNGASLPYYITRYGDSLWCLCKQFNVPVNTLAYMNKFINPNIVPSGYEILNYDFLKSPIELSDSWNEVSKSCDKLTPDIIYNIYYMGSFSWEAMKNIAIPYLIKFLNNSCDIVRYYALISLGRIAPSSNNILNIMQKLTLDKNVLVSDAAKLAIKRIEFTKKYGAELHITLLESSIYNSPNLESPNNPLSTGSEVFVLNWAIPSPSGEKNIYSKILLYDRVYLLETSQEGFIPRLGFNEINMI